MTDLEKLRATSCESLLACLRDRLREWERRLDRVDGLADADIETIADVIDHMRVVAKRIDLKLRMERGE